MKIEIYRYGHYVNAVESKKDLRERILANVPYENCTGEIPPQTPLVECMKIAVHHQYAFNVGDGNGHLDKVLAKIMTYIERTYNIQ